MDTVSRRADSTNTVSSQLRADLVSRKEDMDNPRADTVSSRFKIDTDSRSRDMVNPSKPGTDSNPLKADTVSSQDTVRQPAAGFPPIASERLRLVMDSRKRGMDSLKADTVSPSKTGTDSSPLRVDTVSSLLRRVMVSPSKMGMDSNLLKADMVNPSKPGTDSSPLKADTVSSQLQIPTVNSRRRRLSQLNLKLLLSRKRRFSKLRHSRKSRFSRRILQLRLLQ